MHKMRPHSFKENVAAILKHKNSRLKFKCRLRAELGVRNDLDDMNIPSLNKDLC